MFQKIGLFKSCIDNVFKPVFKFSLADGWNSVQGFIKLDPSQVTEVFAIATSCMS
jgi:hypothetical protein